QGVVQKMVERLGADDLFTLIAFDDRAHVLAQAVSPNEMDTLWSAIRKLGRVGGGGTRAGHAFDAIRDILAGLTDAPRTRKDVLLTDGEDDDPQSALAAAKSVGWDFKVPIVAFGTGECKVAFLTELAKTSLAGAFNHIRDETAAQQLFGQALASQKNVQAVNARLRLWLSPELQGRARDRTRPEVLYAGDLAPAAAT